MVPTSIERLIIVSAKVPELVKQEWGTIIDYRRVFAYWPWEEKYLPNNSPNSHFKLWYNDKPSELLSNNEDGDGDGLKTLYIGYPVPKDLDPDEPYWKWNEDDVIQRQWDQLQSEINEKERWV